MMGKDIKQLQTLINKLEELQNKEDNENEEININMQIPITL